MANAHGDMGALYLGGHPGFPTATPVDGQLRFASDALHFMVMGEYYETLFRVPWTDITGWEVEGANTAKRRTTGGRAAAGALIAGIPGAIVGLAATKEEFEAVLGVDMGGNTIGFLVRDRAPTSLVAAFRAVEGMAELRGHTAHVLVLERWEYLTASLDELDACGKEGWEAVGVWTESGGPPRVLLKRPLES